MFTYISSEKNEGHPSTYSPDERAVMNAFCAYFENGGSAWISYRVTKLPCDSSEHGPGVCWHYQVTIS